MLDLGKWRRASSQNKHYLICCPSFHELGGVANHYLGLAPYLKPHANFHFTGTRWGISGLFFFPFDIISYIIKIVFLKYDLIVLNPSLQRKSIFRDYVFLRVGKLLRCKVIAFIHGWDEGFALEIGRNTNHVARGFDRSDAIIVLCSSFEKALRSWGFKVPIHFSTTKVADIFFETSRSRAVTGDLKSLLFMSRITVDKGIYVALDAYRRLSRADSNYRLTIIGDGPELSSARLYAKKAGLQNINFLGKLVGRDLVSAMQRCECYIFPSWHGEGMPTSVLEALALGMVVVTTKNAGIGDFFDPAKMGEYCEMRSTESLVFGIEAAYKRNKEEISHYNQHYAAQNFSAERVSQSLLDTISVYACNT